MCNFVKKNGVEGVEFRDGTFIPFDDLDFALLTEDQRRQLEEMHLMNELAIRKRLHEHGNLFQNIINRLENIEEAIIEIKNGTVIIDALINKMGRMTKAIKYLGILLGALSFIGYLVYRVSEL